MQDQFQRIIQPVNAAIFRQKAERGNPRFFDDLSSISVWKGCIAVVDEEFNGALVTKEFPIYKMLSDEILPEFLATLLRSRYYQRAFRLAVGFYRFAVEFCRCNAGYLPT